MEFGRQFLFSFRLIFLFPQVPESNSAPKLSYWPDPSECGTPVSSLTFQEAGIRPLAFSLQCPAFHLLFFRSSGQQPPPVLLGVRGKAGGAFCFFSVRKDWACRSSPFSVFRHYNSLLPQSPPQWGLAHVLVGNLRVEVMKGTPAGAEVFGHGNGLSFFPPAPLLFDCRNHASRFFLQTETEMLTSLPNQARIALVILPSQPFPRDFLLKAVL